jgi:predicted amidohydrolase YtcJ
MKMKFTISQVFLVGFTLFLSGCTQKKPADMILINGKIITVNNQFAINEAVAVYSDQIIATGSNRKIKRLTDSHTKIIDLKGKTVVPGLIDSHLHPESASLSELGGKIPDVHTIGQLLAWIKGEAKVKTKGEWIIIPKLFFTRLAELRQPSLAELDSVAPSNPVFLNGSFGGMINSAAMKVSGITGKSVNEGILKNEKTGAPTGFIRGSAFRLLKLPPEKQLSYGEKQDALKAMLKRYNSYGITSVFVGSGDFETIKMYRDLEEKRELTTRIYQNILVHPEQGIKKEVMAERLKAFNEKTGDGDKWVRVGSLKIFLDGGILTGTAYLSEPWGAKAQRIFGIDDPTYKGVLNYSREDLVAIVSAANQLNWSFTVHATGGGSVDLLLDVFTEINKEKSIKESRFSIIHGNFFSSDAIRLMKELGVYANMQPAWFYKDADAMENILGKERIKAFHPYKSMIEAGIMINGGSDHMVKWDADEGINPYNPFQAIGSVVTRKTERGSTIMPSEAITREQALKMYTINNAYASFEESIKGSIEPGKLADMVVLSNDILSCRPDEIKSIKPELTIVGGKIVYSSGNIKLP